MMADVPAIKTEGPWSRELVKEIAMDIGKEIAAYIEVMYPEAVKATSSTFLFSVRNGIFNEIRTERNSAAIGKPPTRKCERLRQSMANDLTIANSGGALTDALSLGRFQDTVRRLYGGIEGERGTGIL